MFEYSSVFFLFLNIWCFWLFVSLNNLKIVMYRRIKKHYIIYNTCIGCGEIIFFNGDLWIQFSSLIDSFMCSSRLLGLNIISISIPTRYIKIT